MCVPGRQGRGVVSRCQMSNLDRWNRADFFGGAVDDLLRHARGRQGKGDSSIWEPVWPLDSVPPSQCAFSSLARLSIAKSRRGSGIGAQHGQYPENEDISIAISKFNAADLPIGVFSFLSPPN